MEKPWEEMTMEERTAYVSDKKAQNQAERKLLDQAALALAEEKANGLAPVSELCMKKGDLKGAQQAVLEMERAMNAMGENHSALVDR